MTLGTEQAQQRLNTLSAMVVGGLAFLVIFSISIMGLLVWLAFHVSSNTETIRGNAAQNTAALCALQADVKARHDDAVIFLRSHPTGLLDKYGQVLISAQQLQKSISDQTATLIALSSLNCTGQESP